LKKKLTLIFYSEKVPPHAENQSSKMRTKTLLLSAALGIATAVPALAQTNVYSVNAVGYVNVAFPVGFSIRANPLNASPNNALSVIFDTNAVPVGAKIYRYDTSTTPASFKIYTSEVDDFGVKGWGANNSVQLPPGEGFFMNTTVAFTNTFVGEVPQGAASNQQVPAGFSLKSSVVPQSGQLDTVLKYPPTIGDRVYRLNADGKTYTISTWEVDDFGKNNWSGTPPAPAVGEGFWLLAKAATTWTRNFDVNQ
jgi:hypothetical protein